MWVQHLWLFLLVLTASAGLATLDWSRHMLCHGAMRDVNMFDLMGNHLSWWTSVCAK
jgi:hypothetical protein